MTIATKGIRTLIGLSVVVGLCYSVSALISRRVYASGCNCSAEQREAVIFCSTQFGNGRLVNTFCDQNNGYYYYTCAHDPLLMPRVDACNDD
jgi:hypothetical protein